MGRGGENSKSILYFFREAPSVNGLESSIKLGLNQESFGTYYCYVNNSVGLGVPCEIDIQGIGVLKNISDTNSIVIGAVIVISAMIVAGVVALIILVCRRRASMEEKCPGLNLSSEAANNDAETSDAITGAGGQPQATGHKWPLRPGVMSMSMASTRSQGDQTAKSTTRSQVNT